MGLVQYDSSDEDEEVQTPVELKVRPASLSLSSAEMHAHDSSNRLRFRQSSHLHQTLETHPASLTRHHSQITTQLTRSPNQNLQAPAHQLPQNHHRIMHPRPLQTRHPARPSVPCSAPPSAPHDHQPTLLSPTSTSPSSTPLHNQNPAKTPNRHAPHTQPPAPSSVT